MPAIPFARFRTELLDFYSAARRPGTFLKVRQALRELAELRPKPKTTADLTPAAITRFIAASRATGRKDPTTASLVSAMRACCALGPGWAGSGPTRSGRSGTGGSTASRPPSRGTSRGPRSAGSSPRRTARRPTGRASGAGAGISACVHGIAAGEALHLRPSDVDLETGFRLRAPEPPRLAFEDARVGPAGADPGCAGAGAAVVARPGCGPDWLFPGVAREGPWTGGQLGARPLDHLHALGERAGVGRVNFQLFRHTFASLAAGWGMGPIELKLWLRHTTVRTQRHYVHPDRELLRQSSRGISFASA